MEAVTRLHAPVANSSSHQVHHLDIAVDDVDDDYVDNYNDDDDEFGLGVGVGVGVDVDDDNDGDNHEDGDHQDYHRPQYTTRQFLQITSKI